MNTIICNICRKEVEFGLGDYTIKKHRDYDIHICPNCSTTYESIYKMILDDVSNTYKNIDANLKTLHYYIMNMDFSNYKKIGEYRIIFGSMVDDFKEYQADFKTKTE